LVTNEASDFIVKQSQYTKVNMGGYTTVIIYVMVMVNVSQIPIEQPLFKHVIDQCFSVDIASTALYFIDVVFS
jgi:hypothetical protein